jgi:hypothetical protein
MEFEWNSLSSSSTYILPSVYMHANYEVPIPLSLGVSWCPIHVDVGRSYDTCAKKLG